MAGALATLHPTAPPAPSIHWFSTVVFPPLPGSPQERQELVSYRVGAGGGHSVVLTVACGS